MTTPADPIYTSGPGTGEPPRMGQGHAESGAELVKGMRVKLSKAGLKHFKHSRLQKFGGYDENMRGTFLKYTRDGLHRILRDGLKFPDTFHWKFWEEE